MYVTFFFVGGDFIGGEGCRVVRSLKWSGRAGKGEIGDGLLGCLQGY